MTDAGGAVVEIMITDAGAAPTKAQLDAWINSANIPVTSVRDPDSLPLQSYNALKRREYAFIVDLSNMKILNRIDGSTAGVPPSAVQQAISQMMQLLGARSG